MEEKQTISYRLGKAILDAKTFSGLKQLPLTLYNLRKDVVEKKHQKCLQDSILLNLRNSPSLSLLNVFQLYGFEGIEVYLYKFKSHYTNNDRAQDLVKLSKELRDLNKSVYINVALKATQISHTEPVLRNLGWCAIESGSLDILDNVLEKLNSRYILTQDISYLKTFNKFKKKREIFESDNGIKPKVDAVSNAFLKLDIKNKKKLYDVIEEIYIRDGKDALYSIIEMNVSHYGLKIDDEAFLYIQVSKKIHEFDHSLEFNFIEKAFNLSQSDRVCKAALNSLEGLYQIDFTKKVVKFVIENSSNSELIKIAKKSYAFSTLAEDYIPKSTPENYNYIDKRVCYVLHNSLPFSSGGYATRALGVCQGLIGQGYDVIVVNRPGFPFDTKPELENISLDEIIGDIRYIRTSYPNRKSYKTFDYILLSADYLEDTFRKLQPEYVIAASNYLTALPALIASKRIGIPFSYEVRGFWEITRISREPEFALQPVYKALCKMEAITAQNADNVFTLTKAMKHELENRGVTKEITILPNSCTPSDFKPTTKKFSLARKLNIPKNVPVIGYIGTFVQYEGLDLLVEACGILKNRGRSFRLILVGNENTSGLERGPITNDILTIAEKYRMEEWLIMPGRVPHEEVEGYYSLIDITPFPRKPQPVSEMVSPMKPLEAAAMKKAILVSSVNALEEMIIDGETGLVFQKGDVNDLANKLEKLLDDKKLRIRLGENSRKWVERERTWTLTTKKLVDALESSSN